MKIYNLFIYLFYSLVKLFSVLRSSATQLSMTIISIVVMSFFLLFNFYLIFSIIGINIPVLFLLITIIIINGALLFYEKRYLKIIDYYDNTKDAKVAGFLFYGYILIVIYIILTFVSLIYFGEKAKV